MIKKDALQYIDKNTNFINFKKKVINSIPKNIFPSAIEQAIFVYYYLCSYYDYDSSFYYSNQEGDSTIKHREFNLINNFDKNEKTAVCYDFDSIYYLIVKDFYHDISLTNTNFSNIMISEFDVHTDVALFLFDLDESSSSLQSSIQLQGSVDMTLLKNAYSKNYKSSPEFIDASNVVKEKFYSISERVIEYLIQNKILLNPVNSKLFTRDERHKLRLEIFDFVKDCDLLYSLDDIVNFLTGLQQIALHEMSYRKYAINLYKSSNLFDKDFFNFCIVKEKISPTVFKPKIIISIKNSNKAIYYTCDFNKKIQRTSHKIIFNNFKNGIYDYYVDETNDFDYRFLIPFVLSNYLNNEFEDELNYFNLCDKSLQNLFLSDEEFLDNPKLIEYFKFYNKVHIKEKQLEKECQKEKT